MNYINILIYNKTVNMYLALFVQQVQDAHLGLDEVDTRLIIIEINESPGDLLFHVLLLLQLKHMLHTRRQEDNRRYITIN